MKRLAILATIALTACTATQQDNLARDAAKRQVRPILAERFPGIPLEPATDCVIDNASAQEILTLAADSVTGPTASTAEIVTRIVSRPETLQCLATEGLPVLLDRF